MMQCLVMTAKGASKLDGVEKMSKKKLERLLMEMVRLKEVIILEPMEYENPMKFSLDLQAYRDLGYKVGWMPIGEEAGKQMLKEMKKRGISITLNRGEGK
jgi:hypothetical protein